MATFTARSRRARAGLLASGLTAAGTSLALVAPAASAPADDCPAPYPVDSVVRDQAVTGLTVDTGTTPAPFTGSVLGVLEGGIGAGMDLIMVRLTSPEIDRVGGIWAGMSGSPVYAEDGRLLGAVAYGFAGTTPVAGVTPAAEMHALLGRAERTAGAPERVELSPRLQRRALATGEVSERQAETGMSRLPLPVAVSGLQGARQMRKAAERLGVDEARFFRAGSAPAAAVSPEEAGIEPGGTLGASLSYGDFSAVGTGTATMVCGEEVVGFGHYMDWAGTTTMTMHGGDTVYVQEDPAWVPFKVANPSGPVGTISQDRLAGVAGSTGALPDTTAVTSSATSLETGFSRTGSTYASMPEWLPDLAALGVVVNNTRVVDKLGEGTADFSFTVSGTTEGGAPFSLTRANRIRSGWDIGWMSPEELYYTVNLLQRNGFTDVDVDDVTMDTELDVTNLAYRVGKVQAKQGGQWRKATNRPVRVAAGGILRLRVTLVPDAASADDLSRARRILRVPVGFGRGALFVGSEGSPFVSRRSLRPTSFADLLTKLEDRPRSDEVVARFRGGDPRGEPAATSRPLDQVVTRGTTVSFIAR